MKKESKSGKFIALGVVIVIVVGAIFFLTGSSGSDAVIEEDVDTGTGIGDLAPDFKLKTPGGEELQLSDFRDKPVLVNFWATWCPFCIDELPLFQERFDRGEVHVLAVNLQEDGDKAQNWFNENDFSMPILLDPNAQVKNIYGVFTQPVTYFLDKNGIIRDKKFGPLTEEEFDEKVLGVSSSGDEVMETSDLPGETTAFGDAIQVTDGKKHIVPLDKLLSGGPGKDGIPSIDNPRFEPLEEGDKWLNDEDIVFGINLDGVKRAYPQRILNWHELVNDDINGKAVAVTFCPLCGSAIAFDSTIDGEAVEFGVSGKLFQSDLVMYDRKTDTYWNQISGKAIVGELVGMKLEKIPLDTLRWGDWKELHPDTEVLSKDTGFFRDYGRYPYGDYETSSRIIFPVDNKDDRLHEKEIVYGIEVNGKFKAYALKDLEGTITDEFNGASLEIKNNMGSVSFKNKDSGEEIVPVRNFWFAWVAHNPETGLYEG